MYFIFIVNDINFGQENLTGQEIVDWLLAKKIWLFTEYTPNLKKFREGDSVTIYVAGKGNRYFYACFRIAGDITEHSLVPASNKEKDLLDYFGLYCPIEEIKLIPEKKFITDFKYDLDFITDKKNYGLFLRQSTKVISENDYQLITKE